MELQFNKTQFPCLRQLVWENQSHEVTQEMKLPDAMPDIGRILGSWGQMLIRSKEWRSAGMSISGGVVVFILYAPEDGSEPRCVESWIPFQMKWDLPESESDGTILASGFLQSVDVRSTSARKMMIRANVNVLAEALEPTEAELFSPAELPEDVQILRRTYPLKVPKEAGEKVFMLDEELTMPAASPDVHKIVRYELLPELIDQKVMAGKVVFRGAAIVHVLYCTEDGLMKSLDFEVPFSQYTDLEHEHEIDADARVTMALTSLELEQNEDDTLQLKAGLIGQYVVYDRPVIEVIEDAFSPARAVTVQMDTLKLPLLLDTRRETLHAQAEFTAKGASEVVDASFQPRQPRTHWNGDTAEIEVSGGFQGLFYNENGVLESGNGQWDGKWNLPSDAGSGIHASVRTTGKIQGSILSENASVRGDVLLEVDTIGEQGIQMVTALNLGEASQPDPNRPSLILRRAGDEGLWEIAKHCGSTVDAIKAANHLTDEPEAGSFLLIPVS